jgi:hypothetical protein
MIFTCELRDKEIHVRYEPARPAIKFAINNDGTCGLPLEPILADQTLVNEAKRAAIAFLYKRRQSETAD